MQTSGTLDDFEVPLHFPISDVFAKLTFFPFPGCCKMIDKDIAEQITSNLAPFEPLCRFPKCRRQGQTLGYLLRIAVSFNLGFRYQTGFDAMQARGDGSGQSEVGIAIGGGDTEFDPL